MGDQKRGTHLSIRDLHKSFGTNAVLRGIDLEIVPGEFVAIVGRSGCGKSTLLRLIAGLDTPTSGSLSLDEEPLHGPHSATRIMFQEARLLPWQRVRDNVGLGLLPRDRAEQALELVALRDRGGDWPAVLSGGQRQRVALARALASGPRLLLLDEPLGSLDALTRREMQQLIERLWQEQGFTTILVTHDVEEAIALADRIIVLEAGQIVQTTNVRLARPRHRSEPNFGRLEESILDRLLTEGSGISTVSEAVPA